MYETIEIDITPDGIATLWLSREEKHNALSAQMMDDLTLAAETLGQDPSVRVVILAARGKTFCAGGDLGWMKAQFGADIQGRRAEAARLAYMLKALNEIPKPLIGRLQGNAFGGGVGMASICDLTIGVETLSMALTETKLGLIPATIGPYVAARMGEARARQVFFSGQRFGADRAQALGLLSHVVAPGDLDHAVSLETAPYLQTAPGAVGRAKALLRQLGPVIDAQVIDKTIDALAACWESGEAEEGISAFFDRRAPRWQNPVE